MKVIFFQVTFSSSLVKIGLQVTLHHCEPEKRTIKSQIISLTAIAALTEHSRLVTSAT